jgi:uncharacterized protein
MHCSSCELLIEKKCLGLEGVRSVDASLSTGEVTISTEKRKNIYVEEVSRVCKDLGYTFSLTREKKPNSPLLYVIPGKQGVHLNWKKLMKKIEKPLLILLIILALRFMDKLEVGRFMSASGTETLTGLFILGAVASVSSCAALIGGLLLSLTKQWNEQYITETNLVKKARPHVGFHVGRILGYIVFGGVLGLLGSAISFDNPQVFAFLVLVISLVMFIIALQMLGVRVANRIRFRMPSFLSRYAVDQSGKDSAPALIGVATFFLPCGFTLIAQGVALASGNMVSGAATMGVFALGTLPALLAISFAGLQMNKKPHLTAKFNFVAGVFVLLFALYNINGQLNVLGWTSLNDVFARQEQGYAVAVESRNGRQEINLTAKGFSYIPQSSMKIKAGVPTSMVVDNQGIQGCGAFIMVSGLMKQYVALDRGKNTIDLGNPRRGTYKITCSMGMVKPVILQVT